MKLEEKFLSREEIYDGFVLHLVKDTVLLPDGNEAKREICLHKGASAVIPLTDEGEVIMVKQFRYATEEFFLKSPQESWTVLTRTPFVPQKES